MNVYTKLIRILIVFPISIIHLEQIRRNTYIRRSLTAVYD